ncbi:30S ribosomal protein S16 [Spiroplasma endosymbiont of Lasioglossum malachurum]|uniref:30S ribosomal protein S16 n=1 Tax=Spiroplasma endosymbiont of Lasioglossum malachurum TaxID=3066319 RepID=UPI0030CF71BE
MVKLRLIPTGKSKSVQPSYRIVAIDARTKLNGRYIDKLGTYNPTSKEKQVTIDEVKALKFLSNGAQPTETVRSLLSAEGIMTKFHNLRQERKSSKPKKITKKVTVKNKKTPTTDSIKKEEAPAT